MSIYDLRTNIIGTQFTQLKLTACEIFASNHTVGARKISEYDLADRRAVDTDLTVLNIEIIKFRTARGVKLTVFQSVQNRRDILFRLHANKAKAVLLQCVTVIGSNAPNTPSLMEQNIPMISIGIQAPAQRTTTIPDLHHLETL